MQTRNRSQHRGHMRQIDMFSGKKQKKSTVFKLKTQPAKPKVTEHALTYGIRQFLNLNRIWHFKHWGGPMAMKGVADIIGCHQGRMFAIEIKTDKGRVSPHQQKFLDAVNEAGGIAFVARSIEDVSYNLGVGVRFRTNM